MTHFKISAAALACAVSLFTNTSAQATTALASGQGATMTVNATVLSSSPVVQPVQSSQQICRDTAYQEPARGSGAGALMGAIAGGAIGNSLGKGMGRALLTGAGVIAGAAVGDHVETDGRPGAYRNARECYEQPVVENKVVGYNVSYELYGQVYSYFSSAPVGNSVAVQVTMTPVGNSGASFNSSGSTGYSNWHH